MPNINVGNISDLDMNGNNLFEDSESFINEITDDDEQSVIGGYYYRYHRRGYYKNPGGFYGGYNAGRGGHYRNFNRFYRINNCGNTVACVYTLGG